MYHLRHRRREKLTFKLFFRLLGEGTIHLINYLVKYIPWIILVAIFFKMMVYEIYRETYCTEIMAYSDRLRNEEQNDYIYNNCDYLGPFYLANVDAIRRSYQLDRPLSMGATIILCALIPFGIARFYAKTPFPPKTVTQIIFVFIFWFLAIWIVSAMIVYNPFLDWLTAVLA